MPKVYTDDELREAVHIRSQHPTNKAAAKALGVREQTMTSRLRAAAQRGIDGSVPSAVPTGFQVKGTSKLYRKNEAGDWEERLQWVKTKEDENFHQVVQALKEALESYQGRAELTPKPQHVDADLLSIYPIADQHLGLMAWGQETGEDYDLKIGSERLRTCARRLVAQSPNSKHAVILNLGDWQHADDARNVTPQSGHHLDVDGRYMKVLTTGVEVMMDVIDMALTKHDNVLVRNLPGNHDPHASIALTVALAAFYHREPRVTIDDDPSEFFYYRFGNTLIGANHGHRIKPADMAMMMAARRREDWGATKFHYFYFGHIHHITAREVGGVVVESFQTLAARDAWSHAKGFSSGQSLTSITHHIEDGEIGRHRVSI